MIRIENWSIGVRNEFLPPEQQDLHIKGEVYNHPLHEDGKKVVTSPVVIAAGLYVETKNSRYLLGTPSSEYLIYLESIGYEYNADCPIKVIV